MALSPRTAGPSGGWTDDAVETLARLWRAGDLSAAIIARRLGVTRNAVLGKIHRLGLSTPRATRSTPKPPRPRRPRPVRFSTAPPAPTPKRPPSGALAETGPGLVARFEDLPRGACHWPVGDPKAPDFAFCGRPAGTGPYCAAHAAVAYRGQGGDLAGLARLLRR